jgi:predicted metal-dependent peptidase
MSLHDRLKKARLNLILDAPFFGTLAFKLESSLDPATPASHVDGKTIRINPDYAAKLTEPQLAGQMIENIIHCAQGHLWRRGARDLERWNAAADQASWEIISKLQHATDGRITMPPNGHCKPQYAGLSTEEIYHLMEQEEQQQQKNGGQPPPSYQSPGAFDQPASDPSDSPDDSSDGQGNGEPKDGDGTGNSGGNPPPPSDSLEDDWKAAVHQAATVERQKNRGNLPAWLKSLVEELTEPTVPWTDYVREFCHRLSRDDYSFRRPNRRFLQRGFILPSLQSEALGPIVGAFDTSGSIFCYPQLVQAILSEFQGVLDLCRPETMHLLSCDTTIHQHEEFKPGDTLLQFVPEGGGGTDFRPVFHAINDLPEPPACLIFLTDLEGCFPDRAPDFPVLWANFGHPKAKAPFGTTIHVPINV